MPLPRFRLRWLVLVLAVATTPILVWLAIDTLVRHGLERTRGTFAKEGFANSTAELVPTPAAEEDNAAPLLAEAEQRRRAADSTPLPSPAPSAPVPSDSLFGSLATGERPRTLNNRIDRITDLSLEFLESPQSPAPPANDVLVELRELFGSPELTELLALAHRASNRPRFVPAIDYSVGPSLVFGDIGTFRILVRLLNTRALLALHTGADVDTIWDDLLAAERLGLLAAEVPSLIHLLTSIACSGINQRTVIKVVAAGELPGRDAEVLTFFLSYPRVTDGRFARALAFERVVMLDWITNRVLRTTDPLPGESDALATLFHMPALYERLPHRAKRTWVLARLDDNYQMHLGSLRLLREAPVHRWIDGLELIAGPAKDEALMVAVPVFAKILITDLADQARRSAMTIAYAARVRHRETGAWPASLAELGLPDTITVDPCSGHAMHYLPREDGLLVYADGPDQKDDGGRDWQSGTDRSIQDGDIVVELKLSR